MTMQFPRGKVTTKVPGKTVAYGFPWSRTAAFADSLERHGATYGVDPYLTAAISVIESTSKQYRDSGELVVSPDDGSGIRAIGIMQVKPQFWQQLAPHADAQTADGNIELGTAVMADAIRRRGSWQQAIKQDYHPGTDPHSGTTPASYVQAITSLLTELHGAVPEPAPEPEPGADQWRPYPYPPMRADAHVVKPGEGAGFDRVAFRRPRMVGNCNHITDGIPGGDQVIWYRDFFSTGGERAWDALTDTVIADNGDIGLLNDWRDPDMGGRRAGWANGGANGLEGDGVAFYRAYPLINDVLLSKEHVTRTGRAITVSCLASSIELSTANAQEVRCPWDSYPYHPGKQGVNIEQMHFRFATKSCPAQPFIDQTYPKLIAAVKEKLRLHQGGQPSPPPPPPPEPERYTRFGFNLEQMGWFFGNMTRVNDDGSTEQLPFNPEGPLSLFWMHRCDQEGIFPESEYLQAFDSKIAEGRELFATWKNGWTAYLPIDNQRAGWTWLDAPAP